MHRLISARNLSQSSFHSISIPSNNIRISSAGLEIKCYFCRKILLGRHNTENLFLARPQSTKTANALRSQRNKAKYKNLKKYGELLEVIDKRMMETKVSISKLSAMQLSKLASSPVSLGQLHKLTNKQQKRSVPEVDSEILQSVKNKILKKFSSPNETAKINLEDDQCALIYTTEMYSNIEDRFKMKQYIDMVKKSYYEFRKATIYDQRLQDLRHAIIEGLNQEFHYETSPISTSSMSEDIELKSPHAVFKELFIDKQIDSYNEELDNHISHFQSGAISHPAIEDMYDDPTLHEAETNDLEIEHTKLSPQVKSLSIKKAKQEQRKKRKADRNKRRALKEMSMKQDIKELERQGKQEALQRLLASHLQLLCSLDMIQEGRRVLQYYRGKGAQARNHPKVTDINIYNIILHGYASKGRYENVKELLSLIAQDGVQPSPQTYAAVFECIERSNINKKLSLLELYQREMEEKSITLNDLLDKSKFVYDQREVVLQAVRRIQPHFQPLYTPPVLEHDCPLLMKLNSVANRMGLATSPAEGIMTLQKMIERSKKQLQIEIKGEIEVQNVAVKDGDSATVQLYRNKLKETESEWRQVIKQALVRNLGTLRAQSNVARSAVTLYPYLTVLNVNQFVELIMGEINKLVDGSESYSPTLKQLQRDLGTQVYQKYQIDQQRKKGVLTKVEQIYEKYCEWYVERRALNANGPPLNARQAWQTLMHQYRDGASLDAEELPWSMEIRQNIGKLLYNIIINDVKIDVNMFKPKAKVKMLPAVYKVHRPWGRLVRLELKPHPVLARLCAAAARPTLRMHASLIPATAPPVPWTAPHRGAYLINETPLIRLPMNVSSPWKRLEQVPPASLYPAYDSLNQLGEVPWAINKPILDLQLHVFRSGGNKKLDIASPSWSLDTSQFNTGNNSGTDAAAAFRRRAAISRARAEMHSLWCDALYKLSLANHYRDEIFWLPHNMDFRGRTYACPPHVSQLGADAARALLVFARRRPLGPRGLRWLQLHAVNLTGTMKQSTIEERLDYAKSIMDKILDSADNPLDGEGWWMQSEEPWQTLACCKEIANAVRSPNPEEYECGFPVHQDGSCNGLQHYAALGGDAAGAAAVNLAPASRPRDVYTAVAALVEEMRVRDAKAEVPAAIALEGFVRRKVIKQTVMTTVYGVTKFGARLQIAKQLKDIDDFPKDQVWPCSQYLTMRTFDSLREMFTSTKQIQDWLTDCAKLISGVCGESVEWVTPLGLPVVQPYYGRAAPTSAEVAAAQCRATLDYKRPCSMKQRNAFPPNFIHSLDSSHMMLTSLHCQAAAITFVSVHDCFWTHPLHVDAMNKICREQFVALHSQPILNELSKFLVKRYSYSKSEFEDGSAGASDKSRVNKLLQKVPSKGDFDINSVLDSVYFFS